MNQLFSENIRICGKCHQGLPLEAFYFNKKTQTPDCYCKECRGKANRMVRKTRTDTQTVNTPRCYLVLTRVEDPELRLQLILHAQQVVNESIARKQKRVWKMTDD